MEDGWDALEEFNAVQCISVQSSVQHSREPSPDIKNSQGVIEEAEQLANDILGACLLMPVNVIKDNETNRHTNIHTAIKQLNPMHMHHVQTDIRYTLLVQIVQFACNLFELAQKVAQKTFANYNAGKRYVDAFGRV